MIKKFRIIGSFCALTVSFLLFHAGINSFETWYLMMLALFLLPIAKVLIIRARKSEIKERSVTFLDLVLLNLKAGQSLRKSLVNSVEEDESWFKSFKLSLIKSLETGAVVETQSNWFNRFTHELLLIEKSRNKVIEQLEVLRRYMRSELHFRKKIKNVTSGPRAQVFVMSLLFIFLNFFCFRGLEKSVLATLLPIAWFLFLMGVITVFCIVRSFKWKV